MPTSSSSSAVARRKRCPEPGAGASPPAPAHLLLGVVSYSGQDQGSSQQCGPGPWLLTPPPCRCALGRAGPGPQCVAATLWGSRGRPASVMPVPSEIPTAQGAEEEEDRQVWHGRPHHPLPHRHHLVPPALHVSRALCGRCRQPAHRRHCHPQAGRLRGERSRRGSGVGGSGRGSTCSRNPILPCLQPLFTMSAQQPSIMPFTPQDYEELCRQFDAYPVSGSMPGQPGEGRRVRCGRRPHPH